MINYQDYLTNKVDKAAAECGITAYQAAELSDCGWWVFKDNDDVTKAKLYYYFDSDFCSVGEGRGSLSPGGKCHDGNDADENKLLDYVKGLLPKALSLEECLANASKRSIESSQSDAGVRSQRDAKSMG